MSTGENSHTVGEKMSLVSDRLEGAFDRDEAGALTSRLFLYRYSTNKTGLLMLKTNTVSADDEAFFEDAVERLLAFEPLQYITGECEFFDLRLKVNSSVLIPRPETEELVSLAIIDARTMIAEADSDKFNILDIGTGSGCIALSIRSILPQTKVYGIDVSEEALKVARQNAASLNLMVDLRQGDILDPGSLAGLPEINMIVSNPPYVTEHDKLSMHPNVLNYEPGLALYVPDNDPLIYYRSIAGFAREKLTLKGSVWLEINESFGEETKTLMQEYGFVNSKIYFDFRGKERFLHCKRQ